MTALEALHELRRMAHSLCPRCVQYGVPVAHPCPSCGGWEQARDQRAPFPPYIHADNGTRLALSNVTGKIGLYDGPDGYAMTLPDALRFASPR